jgi:N-acetylglucosaminyldiphosphoundecaprenol N-acetyl-beta-D-mannosaminyltransferase
VGGALDVVAGKVRRAPMWMRWAGLEWLFRLAQEPRRMWRRYLVTNTIFLFLLLGEMARTWLSRKKS